MSVGLEERVSERLPLGPLLLAPALMPEEDAVESIAAPFRDRVIMVVVGWL